MDLLWTDFINSYWRDWRGSGRSEDRLDKPQWLAEFLSTWQLGPLPPPDQDELAALKALRSRLVSIAVHLAGGAALPPPDEISELNDTLARSPVIRRVAAAPCRVDLVPVRTNWAAAMAEIAASCAQSLAEGHGARIRICENPDCRWVFYDETRNGAKRFCDDKQCGNLIKVRRFRARQKEK